VEQCEDHFLVQEEEEAWEMAVRGGRRTGVATPVANPPAVTVEVCTASIESVLAARRAPRVELCSGLQQGGVTPSAGLIAAATAVHREVHVLIRPRPADFIYSPAEMNVMLEDIEVSSLPHPP
jgi:hypothetical protein